MSRTHWVTMFLREARGLTLRAILPAAAAVCGLACGGGSADPEPIAVVGATLIDGTARGPVEDAVVLVRHGRFECAGARASCPIPPDARVIDGTGHWVVPAFIDTHVHLWWLADSAWTARAQTLRLAAGITTVREMASSHQLVAVLEAARAAEDASHPSPRIFVSGRVAAGADGNDTADDFGVIATRLIERGVDGLKIKGYLSPGDLADLLGATEGAGYPVYGHAPDAATTETELENAFQLGLDGVNHVLPLASLLQNALARSEAAADRPAWVDLWKTVDPELEDRLVDAMLAEDVWLEPTLVGTYFQVNPAAYAEAPDLEYLPAEMADGLNGDTLPSGSTADAAESLRRMLTLVGRFNARGGTLVVGTDQLEFPASGVHEEMALLVEAGLTPEEALRAATSNAALALGWEDRLGTVEAGKAADMVLLRADPLADIRNTREVGLVFKGGVAYDPELLEAELAPGRP